MSGCTAPDDDDGGLAAPPAVDAASTFSTATTCIRCHAPAVISARGTTHCRSCFLHSLHSRFTKAIQGAKLAARDGVDQYERTLLTGTTSSPEKGPAGTRRKSRMVVACSGGPASTALVNLVYRSLFASSPTPIRASDDPAAPPAKNKRGDRYSQFQPFEKCDVVYIDESAVPGFGSDRTDEVQKLVASISPDIAFTALRLEDIFDGADSPLVVSTTSADLPVLASASSSSADAASPSARDRLVSLLSPSSPTSLSPTALASLHRSLLNSLLLSHARKQGADVLFLGETGTRTAIRVLSGMSEGRGHSAGEEVAAEYVSRGRSAPTRDRAGPRNGSREEEAATATGSLSVADAAVLVVRPLAQMVNKEIAFYNRDAELEPLIMVNTETSVRPRGEEALEVSAKKRSIPGLVEDFIVTLDADFPSTVPTVVRTAHKLGLRSSHAAFLSHSADEQSDSIASSETAALCPMCGLPAQPRADEWRKAITISDLQGALAQAAASTGADQQPTKRTLVEERSAAADGKSRKREPYQPSKAHLLGDGEELQSAEAATASGGKRDVATSNGDEVASSAGENATEIKDEPSPASDSTLAPYLCYGCLLVLSEPATSHGATQSAAAKRKAAARGGAGATAGVRADQLVLPPYVGAGLQIRRGFWEGGVLARKEVRGEEELRKEVEQYLL